MENTTGPRILNIYCIPMFLEIPGINKMLIIHVTFLKLFRQRLIDIATQNWYGDCMENGKLCTYSMFKKSLEIETYLT